MTMRNYRDAPEKGELVVIEIDDINPHSVYATLEAFPDVEGMIHISEVSRSWVRDIKKHLNEGEKDVAQVIEEEDDSGTITLSLKRVNDKQKRETMQAWKKEQKAEKFLEKVGETVDEEMDTLMEAIAFPFQREFDNTFDGFEQAVIDQSTIEGVIDDDYLDAVVDVAEDNISLKQVKLEGKMDLSVPTGDGLSTIKEALETGEGVDISYISAPEYKIIVWGRNQDQAKQRMDATLDDIEATITDAGGTFSFERA